MLTPSAGDEDDDEDNDGISSIRAIFVGAVEHRCHHSCLAGTLGATKHMVTQHKPIRSKFRRFDSHEDGVVA
jgi:hypothetical protein